MSTANGIKLFEYLEKLALLNISVKSNLKNLSVDEEFYDLEDLNFLPVLDKVFLKSREVDEEKKDGVLLSITRYDIEKIPKLPKELERWVNIESITFVKPTPHKKITVIETFDDDSERIDAFDSFDPKEIPFVLKKWVTKNDDGEYEKITERNKDLFFEDYPELKSLYDDWIDNKWKKWQEKNKEFLYANQAYDKFYSLRGFLKTEMDSFDLLWAHDIITWKKNGKEIYHPTLFTPIILEFDTESNTISFIQDSNSKTFFDVAFVREVLDENSSNLVDIDELAERINTSDDFDVWDYEMVHKYLQKLVRYISSDGESKYNDRNQKLIVSSAPTVFNHHNIFLLKKTGKTWAEYAKKIQADIEKNNKLTPFLEDLVGVDGVFEDQELTKNEIEDPSTEIQNTELYFPLPSNEEQRQISKQIDATYGAVVQGPPGTGKTHTIANLISRFLAQGKTVLVTSQTGQALSVLKNKIPKSIRGLAVSQVEANSRNNDLQSSVAEINTCLSDTTNYTEIKRAKKEVELQNLREKIAKKNNEFQKKSLIDSNEEIIIGIEKINPISAAKFVSSFENNEDFKIKDDVAFDIEIQITQKDIDQYVSLLLSLDSEVWSYCLLDEIPTLDKLPKIEEITHFFELNTLVSREDLELQSQYLPSDEAIEQIIDQKVYFENYLEHAEKSELFRKDLAQKYGVIESKNEIISILTRYTEDYFLTLEKSLLNTKNVLLSINEKWEQELLKISTNAHEKERVKILLIQINHKIEQYKAYDRLVLGKQIKISEVYKSDYKASLQIVDQMKIDAKNNGNKLKKGPSLILKSKLRKFIKDVFIDEKEIETIEDLAVIDAFFSKIKLEANLCNLWDEVFVNTTSKKDLPARFTLIEYELLLQNIKRITNFEDEHQDLKKKLDSFEWLESISVLTIDSLKNALHLIESLISIFKVKEYSNIFEAFKEELSGKNPHVLVEKLHKAIDSHNYQDVSVICKQIIDINKRKKVVEDFFEIKNKIYNPEVKKIKDSKNIHKSLIQFSNDIESQNLSGIKGFYTEVSTLIDQQNKSFNIKKLEDKIGESLPKTIESIKSHVKKYGNVDIDLTANIKWKRLVSWLDYLHQGDEISKISKEIQILKQQERNVIEEIVSISSWMFLRERITKPQKEALASFALSMKKYGKGMGKYASKHLRDAKAALEIGKDAVPVWIMPINTIHQLFPNPTAGMFDVVIFDEASQVDTRGLNIAYLGKKLLVVGDDEQVSPTSFVVQSKVSDLISRYISDVPNSTHFSSTSSLFDIAKIKMTNAVTLTEHFRSIEEIIGFSNSLCYDGKLKILRDQLLKYRLDPVLEAVFIETGYEETNAQINKPEAEVIVMKLKELLNDPLYRETNEDGHTRPVTFGVISLLGKEQSKYITKLISEHIDSKEIEKRNIICGDPYVFQGDERHVILLSMVKAPDLKNPDKNITPYTVAKKENRQRMNVAMSRAKNKMILFHSIPKDSLTNPNDLRKMILDWFYNRKAEERKAGLQRVREEVERGRASEFEFEVAKLIVNKGFKVIPQYEVAGYRIDLVIQGENAKLAIECDGDQYHNNFEKWQEDIQRQEIIERAGWKFWRLSGSSFYRNKENALDSLWVTLDDLGIKGEL